jgi:AraC family transcriptional regulator
MRYHEIAIASAEMTNNSLPCRGWQMTPIVIDEQAWRTLPDVASIEPRIVATRWHAVAQQTQEARAETPGDRHIVKIVLRNMNVLFSVAGRTVQDGLTTPGMVHITEPAAPAHCVFRGPYDVLHLHVPNRLIAECAHDMPGQRAGVFCPTAAPTKNPVVERLAHALLAADQDSGSFGQLYADCIGVAIVARLLATAGDAAAIERPKVSELARWRLRRALDYFDAKLAEPVRLADVAAVTGLTRMHFAAQFRAATGLSPHEFLLRRRIERAQEMLAETDMPVVDIALSVGFQTQSHFTTVFRRFVGQPPQTWRRARDNRAPPGRIAN